MYCSYNAIVRFYVYACKGNDTFSLRTYKTFGGAYRWLADHFWSLRTYRHYEGWAIVRQTWAYTGNGDLTNGDFHVKSVVLAQSAGWRGRDGVRERG